jgi:hypothetical protein
MEIVSGRRKRCSSLAIIAFSLLPGVGGDDSFDRFDHRKPTPFRLPLWLTEAGSPAIGCWCGVDPGKAFSEIEQHFTDRDPGQYVYAADVFAIRDALIERLDIYYR